MIDNNLKKLKLFYQNVRGLRTKTNEFYNNLLLRKLDVILITETWLCDGILDAELCDGKYNLFRRDRGSLGGGVMALCGVHLQAYERPEWQRQDLECIWLTIPARALGSLHDLHIAVIYIPPNALLCARTKLFMELMTYVYELHSDDYFMIAGDFNLPCIDWSTSGFPTIVKKGSIDMQNLASSLVSCSSLIGLSQYNLILNSANNTLDLLFSNTPVDITISNSPLVNEDKFHPSLSIVATDIFVPLLKAKPRLKNQFRRGDYISINTALQQQDWSFINKINNIDAMIEQFYAILHKLIKDFVPQVSTSNTYNYPVWYSRSLIRIIKEKTKAHADWKSHQNPNDHKLFAELRKQQKVLQDECYSSYINRCQDNIKANPKCFWSYVKSKRKNSSNYPQKMTYKEVTLNTPKDICSAFNKFFENNFSPPASSYFLDQPNDDISRDVIHSLEVNPEDIHKLLLNLDSTKGAGCDNIPPIFFIKCADELCFPIASIYNRCLKEGFFPNIWKQAHIVPIHKKGSVTHIENYRPISILNVLSKLFEKVVHVHIYPTLAALIPPEQHGFMKGRSTTTNLGVFIDSVNKNMDRGSQVDVVYTDFEKAFDRVDHIILLHKLSNLGIRGNLLRWTESYLRNRSQSVVVGGFCSDYVTISSGVPQGSILGPLLYAAYLFDIVTCLKHSQLLMYADDTKIFMKVQNQSDCMSLQNDLDTLAQFFINNRLGINVEKCSHVSFTRKKHPIQFTYKINGIVLKKVNVVRDLGVIMDNKLTFSEHIDLATNKAYKSLGFILRVSRPFSDVACLRILYYSYVRSILEYCSSIWNPQYVIYIQSLEKIQIKFVKHLNYRTYHGRVDNYEKACNLHHLCTLENRRVLADMSLLHALCNGYIDCLELSSRTLSFNVPKKRTRHTKLFAIPQSGTNYAQNTLTTRLLRTYNKKFSSIDVFNSSKMSFKREIFRALQ